MKKNFFLVFWAVLVLGFCSETLAQQTATTDVIYLKNGHTVRGRLLKIKGGKKLKLRSDNGALYNFRFAEIERLEKVEVNQENLAEPQREPGRKVRFTNITELSYAGGGVKQKIDDVELDFTQYQSTALVHTINGLQFGRRFTAGIGTGMDWYMSGGMVAVPVFIDLRGTTKTTGPIKPEALFSAGFAINPKEMDKGAFASGGLGVKIKRYNNTAVHLSLNYRYQQFARTQEYSKKVSEVSGPGQYIPATLKVNTTYNQFEVRIGHSF